MSFEKLLGDLQSLQTLQKSEPAGSAVGAEEDDAKVGAAAADGEAVGEASADEGDADDAGGVAAGDNDGDEPAFGKSFEFTTEDGQTVEAVDGTELVKSLMTRIDEQETSVTQALGIAVDLIKSQGAAISTLQSEVKRLAGEGRGRKATVSISEKPVVGEMAKSEPAGMSGEEFMNKALAAQAAGKISALDVSIAEGSLLKSLPVRADIVQRVLS